MRVRPIRGAPGRNNRLMSTSPIRPLTPADAAAYFALRRRMLVDSPWAFSSSPDDDRFTTPEAVAEMLSRPGAAVVGAFAPDEPARLAAAAGVRREPQIKVSHRASIWGVYCEPDLRGRGYGEAVMRGAIEAARGWPGVEAIALSASERSDAARRLYERLGFVVWGREPRALVLDGRAYDEVHMVLFLNGSEGRA